MEVSGQFLGITTDGSPLVGLLVQGPGRSLVKWFAPREPERAGQWAERFTPGEPVICTLVEDQAGQRMMVEEMRRIS